VSEADPEAAGASMRVLRVYHSGVVGPWRRRERELRELGLDLVLVSPRQWNEGGRRVALVPAPDEVIVVARTIGTHPYGFVYDPLPIWRALRSGRFDVIDLHEEPASLAAAEVWILARLAGSRAPVCLYCAQNIEKRYPPPFRWIERATLRRAAGVHTCNTEAGHILRRKGFSGVIRDLGLGVDVERFAPRPADSPPPRAADGGNLRLGYVGRLEVHKGVEGLIRAVAATADVELVVVGDGPERTHLDAVIIQLGLADRVSVRGFSALADLPDVYREFDVVVVPSLDTPSWIEQFGRVAVEAMASGVVVVASRSGALPEVVGDAAVLVTPGDVAELSDVLAKLRDDPDWRAELAAAGPARAATFAWPAVAERQVAFYRQLDRFDA
jgi:glycosyltransferase involved in cell wall biosynthesis